MQECREDDLQVEALFDLGEWGHPDVDKGTSSQQSIPACRESFQEPFEILDTELSSGLKNSVLSCGECKVGGTCFAAAK